MENGIRCTWWEPTGTGFYELHVHCECGWDETVRLGERAMGASLDWEDAPWPTVCASCGVHLDYDSPHSDTHRSSVQRRLFRCLATGQVGISSELPAGAIYDAFWLSDMRAGPDGRSLMCVLPDGHHWWIDGRASNCTMPDDEKHRCWCRHGDPPDLTVDKADCHTCEAGAGSIQSGDYHGFLRNGWLVP